MKKRRWAHLRPRYIFDRFNVWLYERAHPTEPWLVRTCTAAIESWLNPTDVGIEWGSGRSTLWLAKRVRRLISVEHDGDWYRKLCASLADQKIQNVEAIHIPDRGRYATAVDICEPGTLDFALVDGKWRDECILAAIPKLKPSGMIILDNADRYIKPPHLTNARGIHEPSMFVEGSWGVIAQAFWAQRCLWFSNGVWSTAVFFPRLQDVGRNHSFQ